ncbi:MAG: hypothetical protein Ct9H300mP16_12010 [Pseudomonadota bacterium]|nr:MAG: hypothetical protein Ct9H300mP16_12010 [Pseudomonadota bacterium]
MKRTSQPLLGFVLNQELGEPFRRDAMKTPVKVAGIDPADMQQQQVNLTGAWPGLTGPFPDHPLGTRGLL